MQAIGSNLVSLVSQRGLSTAQTQLSESVERLSSGLRINHARDDVAGLGISQELQRQTRSTVVGMRNANDAISMIQTADGALASVSDMLGRLKELTVQGANESLSKDQRQYITAEIAQLRDEINAVAQRTTFNNTKLLTGDFAEAIKGEFTKASELAATNQSVLRTSTIKIGESSDSNPDLTKSLFSFADVQVDSADPGKYSLSNDGATITLSRTVGNVTQSQSLTIVSGAASSKNEVAFNNTLDGTMTLDFSDFGVSITVKNDRIGTSDRSASEIATKIAAISITPNESYKNQGWKAVSGADWASGAGTLKAIITSTAGNIRLTSTSGISSVKGYNGAAADGGATDGSLTNGTATTIAFKGTAAQLNAVLKTLEVNSSTGLGEVTVDVLPNAISMYTNAQGVTSYYEVVSPGNLVWSTARSLASARTFNGLTGYLANLTSTGESTFIQSKLAVDGWIGASDEAVEGVWRWMDGPEAGLQFWQGVANGSTVSGGAGQVTTPYANWAFGEPNNAGGEDYAYAIGGGNWNDYSGTNNGPTAYIVEYGGVAGVSANTSKTILIGTAGYINVGNAIQLDSIATTGVGAYAADTGTYKMTADAASNTVTMNQFDVDGETLLASETITVQDALGSGRYTTFSFTKLGVSATVSNVSDRAIEIGDAESGLNQELTVATSRMASLIGKGGPAFQIGQDSRHEVATTAFRDIRLGKNADSEDAGLFNEVDSLITGLANSADPQTSAFQRLENKIEDLITVISDRRSAFGSMENRLTAAINNINEQYTNLTKANSQIQDTDFAWETARLTRLQIGQQAATAMLAQANQIPNVILALLK